MQTIKRAVKWLFANDLFNRAFNTFWQTGLVFWLATDGELSSVALAGTLGAAFSAAKGVVLAEVKKRS